MEKAKGSSPFSSTQQDFLERDREGFELAGLVAGEGCFRAAPQGVRTDGSARVRFIFTIGMAARDRPMLERLRAFLGFGSLHVKPRRKEHHEDVCVLTVSSSRAHHAATLPFGDRYLLFTRKRTQYEAWKHAFLEYEREHPPRWGRGASICSVPGCGRPVRGRGLCRSHYYEVTGH